jgi:GH35 family endo-1,4-beta-xylanase
MRNSSGRLPVLEQFFSAGQDMRTAHPATCGSSLCCYRPAPALADALTDADAYIAANRRGNVTVATGLSPGTQVAVSLKRLAFNFGTAIPGNSSSQVTAYLGSSGTAQQTNFQAKLLENFNAVTMENAGKWDNTESTRGQPALGGVNTILDFASAHGLYARYHNVFWDSGRRQSIVGQHAAHASGCR